MRVFYGFNQSLVASGLGHGLSLGSRSLPAPASRPRVRFGCGGLERARPDLEPIAGPNTASQIQAPFRLGAGSRSRNPEARSPFPFAPTTRRPQGSRTRN